MNSLSGGTLVIAIQAVDAEMSSIEEQLDIAPPDERPDLDEVLLSYQKAANELRSAYEQAQLKAINLPPYEELVRSRSAR